MKKKITAVIMSIVVLVTSISLALYSYANDKTVDVNVKLLESVLNDRYWVVDTLVNGDISKNPYAVINSASNSTPLMQEVLENYQTNASFKALVDVMEHYSNLDEYINGLSDEVLEGIVSILGLSSSDGVGGFLNDISSSTKELKYESILNEVLKADYTSSWGDTLREENMLLENLQQQAAVLKKLKSYQVLLKDHIGITTSPSSALIVYDDSTSSEPYSDYDISMYDYVDHFMDAYSEDLESYINQTLDIPALEGKEALKEKIMSTGFLGVIYLYESTVLPEFDSDLGDIYYDELLPLTMQVMKGVNKGLDISRKSMDCAILMEALLSQKDSTVAVMNRIADQTSDEDLVSVLENYSNLANAEGNNEAMAYEIITNYLRNNDTVNNIVKKATSKSIAKHIENRVLKYNNASEISLYYRTASDLTKVAAIAELTLWVADKATNIEDTAKKIYVLKYLDKIIEQAINTYQIDIDNYYNNRSDENAEKVLDDLDFIKALRLYGEKTAYGSICSQTESWIGILLGGDNVSEFLSDRYQAQLDVFLGCTFTPVSNKKLVLNKNDVLNLMSETVNGKEISKAFITRSSGKTEYIAEADCRLLGGVSLNDSTINILNAPNGIYLPLIESKGKSTINIYCDDVSFGNINNESTLNINCKNNTSSLDITELLENQGQLNLACDNNINVSICDINNTSNITASNCCLCVKGTLKNDGTVNGFVNICGDGYRNYENHYFKIKGQTLKGVGTYTNLSFNNYTRDGVTVLGTSTVTKSLSNSRTRIKNGKNIVATDNCQIENGSYYGDVTVKNYTSPAYTKFKSDVYVSGTVDFSNNALFAAGLYLQSDCQTFTINNDLTVNGDLKVSGGNIVGTGVLNLKGDLNVATSSVNIQNLNFKGLTPQSVTLSNALTVATLDNSNTSLSGVDITGTINVTDYLYCSDNNKFLNGNNIVLTSTARVDNDVINGSITANGWTCNRDKLTVKGTLNTIGEVTLSGDIDTESLIQSSGTITVADNACINTNSWQSSGNVIVGNNSNIITDKVTGSNNLTIGDNSKFTSNGDFVNNGTITNNGTLEVKSDSVIKSLSGGNYLFNSDVNASGNINVDTITFEAKVPQEFKNTSSTKVANLIINNSSKSGFSANSVINVLNMFNDNCEKIIHEENIVLDANAQYFTKGMLKDDFHITGSFTVPQNEILTIKDNLYINPNATITIEEGASLIVGKASSLNQCTVNIDNGGQLVISDYLNSTSSNFNIDGNMIIKGDVKLTSSIINADGLITFKGDLNSSSCIWNNPNIAFVSGVPQSISGSTINANNLTVNNTSKSGITFSTTINYYGTLDNNSININSENYLVSKA